MKGFFENRVAEHRRFISRQMIGDHIGPFLFMMIQKRWSMAFFHTADDMHILMWFHAITHGPKDRSLI